MAKHAEYTHEEIAAAVGQALKSLRKDRGLSQSDVYNSAQLDRNSYQKYDAGRVARPMLANLIKIAEAMDTTPGVIVDKAYAILKKETE